MCLNPHRLVRAGKPQGMGDMELRARSGAGKGGKGRKGRAQEAVLFPNVSLWPMRSHRQLYLCAHCLPTLHLGAGRRSYDISLLDSTHGDKIQQKTGL